MISPARQQKHLTRAQAEGALATLREHYAGQYKSGYGPQLIEDFPGPGTMVKWAVVWVEAPFEWAIQAAEENVLQDPFIAVAPVTGRILALAPQR